MRFTLEIFGKFIGFGFGPLLLLLAWAKLAHPGPSFGLTLLFVVLFLALASALAVVIRHINKKGPNWAELGVCKGKRSLWHLLWQIPFAVLIPAIIQMLVMTSVDPNAEPGESSLESAAATGLLPMWALVLGLISFVVIGPLLEEVVFRGVLVHELRKHVRPVWVIVVSAVIFMALHLAVPVFPFLFVSGLVLAWLRLWHDSLWPSTLAHITGNAIASSGALIALT